MGAGQGSRQAARGSSACCARSPTRSASSASCSTRSCPTRRRKIREALGAARPPALADRGGGPPRPPVPRVTQDLRALPAHRHQGATGAGRPPLAQGRAAASAPEGRGRPAKIPIADFQKVELRVAEVLAAERVPKSKKLLKLSIRVGEETRTLVAGVAEHYEPADLVGRKVVIVANLRAGHADGGRVQRHGAGRRRTRARCRCSPSTRTCPRAPRSSSARRARGDVPPPRPPPAPLHADLADGVAADPRAAQLPRVLRARGGLGRARAADRAHRAGGARSVRGERACCPRWRASSTGCRSPTGRRSPRASAPGPASCWCASS